MKTEGIYQGIAQGFLNSPRRTWLLLSESLVHESTVINQSRISRTRENDVVVLAPYLGPLLRVDFDVG